MISSKTFTNVDGQTKRFVTEFNIASDHHVRVYVHTLGVTLPSDLVHIHNYDIIDNSVVFYTAPLQYSTVLIEVATTPEDFGSSVVLPALTRAEVAATAAEGYAVQAQASAAAAAISAASAALSASNSTTYENNSLNLKNQTIVITDAMILTANTMLSRINSINAKLVDIDAAYDIVVGIVALDAQVRSQLATFITTQTTLVNSALSLNTTYKNEATTYLNAMNTSLTALSNSAASFTAAYNIVASDYTTQVSNMATLQTTYNATYTTANTAYNSAIEANNKIYTRHMGNHTSNPVGATEGALYFNTTTQYLMCYINGAWANLMDVGHYATLSYLGVLASDPVGVQGNLYYNSTSLALKVYNAGSWQFAMKPSSAVYATDSLTVQNASATTKTIITPTALTFNNNNFGITHDSVNDRLKVSRAGVDRYYITPFGMEAVDANLNISGWLTVAASRIGKDTTNYLDFSTVDIFPSIDNNVSLGQSARRFKNIYATNAVIQTSDGRQKQQIRSLNETEKAVALKLKGLIKTFKFNHAVEENSLTARIHTGVIAQEVKAAFESEGLIAEDYSLLCYDTWEEIPAVAPQYDEDGVTILVEGSDVVPAGNRYGIRYDELIAFIIGGM